MRNVPPFRVSSKGDLLEFVEVDEALQRLALELNPDPLTLRFAKQKLGDPAYREAWLAGPTAEWRQLALAWRGLPLESGLRRVDGELYVGDTGFDVLEKNFAVETSEPYELDGNRVVRIVRKTRVTDEDLRRRKNEYLSAYQASPEHREYVNRIQGVHREQAVIDLDSGLPLSITIDVRIGVGMKSPMRTWRENAQFRRRFELEWTLRDGE